jgi:hypothetical protein
MKKLIFLLSLFISANLLSQSFRTIVVEWDDTVTVRDLSNTDIWRIVNSNYGVLSLPVSGLNENLEIFVYRQLNNFPPVDFRLQNVLVEEGCIDSLDGTWTDNRIYARQYTIVQKDTTQLKESVEQEENVANAGVFPYEKQLKYIALYLGILDRKIDGLAIPATLQTLKPKMDDKIELIYQNYVNAQNKKQAINNEESFDIDLGWNDTDPE